MRIAKYLLTVLCISFSLMAGAMEPVKININTATVEEFSSLNGVGPAKAQAIVEYRKQIGEFKSVKELTMVKGIGPSTIKKNKEKLTLE